MTGVTENITVTATFAINEYTVTFKDHDGTELKTDKVEHGQDATAPDVPARTGYTFTGWDKTFTNITERSNRYGSIQHQHLCRDLQCSQGQWFPHC
jgi:hypothetical protein